MQGLKVPVVPPYGLRPALVKGTKYPIAPLTINTEVDNLAWLRDVTTCNVHRHLPHDALTTEDTQSVHVLACQRSDLDQPHLCTAVGNQECNAYRWMPPQGEHGGHILLAGSTILTPLFGGTDS